MTDDAISIDEKYTSATHSSNMRVQSERRGDADVMIAAGWSPSRVGMALLRLHSEYDGVQHPRKMQQAAIEAYAQNLIGTPAQRINQAHADAARWHQHELELLLGKLKILPDVREQLTLQADKWGMDKPGHVAASVLMWWLDRVCPVCHGRQFEGIDNTPMLSKIVCPVCRGSGEREFPCGDDGRRLAVFIDDCLARARVSIKQRLHHR